MKGVNKYLPLMFDTTGMKIIVAGGGMIALRKIDLLLEYGARITVVAPDVDVKVFQLVESGRIKHIKREFKPGDCRNFNLVIAATNSPTVNKTVTDDAVRFKIPLNVADDPALCSVIFPAIHTDGNLVLAVSTGGDAPFMASEFRNRLSEFAAGWGRRLDIAKRFRTVVRRTVEGTVARNKLYSQFASIRQDINSEPPKVNASLKKWLIWLDSLREDI